VSAFILDASYTLAWCFPDRATANTDATLKRLETREDNAIVPWVWQLEVGNALGKAVTRAKVPLARGLQYANKQIVFRIIESLKPWTQVYIDKEDAVRVAQAMDVGHARSLARHAHAFKEEENPVDRKAMSVATCSENMLRGYLAGLGTKTAHPLSESTSRGGPVDGEATFQAESWPWIAIVPPASICTESGRGASFRRGLGLCYGACWLNRECGNRELIQPPPDPVAQSLTVRGTA